MKNNKKIKYKIDKFLKYLKCIDYKYNKLFRKFKQQEKLRLCANDLKLGNALRGWIKQEINSVSKSKNKNNRVKTRLKVLL